LKHRSVILALVIVQVLFSALPIAAKIVLQELSSPAITLARVSGAALLFFTIQRLTIHEPIRQRRDFGRLAYYSLLGVSMNQLLYITGLTMTTATAAQMLITGGPAVTLLIAILLGKERATRQKWIGIALAGAGALVLVGVASLETGALGNVLIVVNMIAYSLYLVSARDMLHRYHPLTVITWLFIFGSVILMPFGLPSLIREFPHTTLTARLLLLGIILLPTVTAYYLNMWALQHVESSVVSTFVYLQPMLTTAMAVPILGERPSLRMVPAALLIFAGVAISIQAARRPDHRPDPADQAVIEP
jgi:drug/metabolite transporter (DMT)-like permease